METATAISTAAPIPAPVRTDFADWLSPMLVKELRQGVRTRVFVSTFILLQVLMLLDVSLSLLVSLAGQDSTAGTVFFWIMVGLPVLVILPFTGLNAIAGETKANTLELIFLTRLTPWRIIVGKWLAIFVQTLLLVCAVLPYLVLRYFIGGVNISSELETLGLMLRGSALLAAFATGLSAYPLRVVRPLSVLFIFVLFAGGSDLVGPWFTGEGGTGPPMGSLEAAGLNLCGAILLVLMLEVGAARIAPPAENHSAVMRLLALGGLAVALAASLAAPRSVPITVTAFVVAIGVCTVALCEEPRWIPTLFRPFAIRGWPARIAGRLLYPGWYTGVLFTVLVFAAFGALMAHQKMLGTGGHVTRFIAVFGTLLFPVAVVRVCFPRTKKAVALFFAVQSFCVIALICASVCDNALKTSLKGLVAVLPLCTLLLSVSDGDPETAARLGAVGITTLASLVALLAAIIRPLHRAGVVETQCLPSPTPPTAPPVA